MRGQHHNLALAATIDSTSLRSRANSTAIESSGGLGRRMPGQLRLTGLWVVGAAASAARRHHPRHPGHQGAHHADRERFGPGA